MSDAHADAGVAGAEALLGLAAGNNVRLPSVERLQGPSSVREPPPLELPTQSLHNQRATANVSEPTPQPTAVFVPTPPALSIPSHHASSPSQPPQQPEEQPKTQQPPQSNVRHHVAPLQPPSQYVSSHHIPPPPPSHHSHELPHAATRPSPSPGYLSPPQTSTAGSQHLRPELPSVASLGQWAPRPPPLADANAHYGIPDPRPTYDPIHHAPNQGLPSLQGSSAHLSSHPHVQQSPPAWESQTALPPPQDYWPPPSHHGYPYRHPSSYYYPQGYYHSAPPQPTAATPSQSHLSPPTQSSVHLPSYTIPTTLHQPSSVMRAPSLALPVTVQHGVSSPSTHGLRRELPPVHEHHGLRVPLPSIDPNHYITRKDDVLFEAQKRVAISDKAVSKVPDIETGYSSVIGANGKVQDENSPSVPNHARARSPEPESTAEGKRSKTPTDSNRKSEEPTKKPRSGIFDIVNRINKSPGRTSSDSEVEKDGKNVQETLCGSAKNMRQTSKEALDSEQKSAQKGKDNLSGEGALRDLKTNGISHADKRESVSIDSVDAKGASEKSENEDTKASVEQQELHEDMHIDERRMGSDNGDDDEGDSERTICPCGSEESSGLMIACDECNAWQHSKCMGIAKNSKVQDNYYCDRCRPEEIRPHCVAYRRHKERMLARERASREITKEVDPLLVGIKPVELRKHFAVDLKEKSTGRKLAKGEVFYYYANLLRNQFTKYRQGIIEGITILLSIRKADAADRLDASLKRIRNRSGEKPSEETQSRRKSSDGVQDIPQNDNSSGRSGSHGRINPQKRPRPHSLITDQAVVLNNVRSGPGNPCDSTPDQDIGSVEHASSRSMSREERKLQQAMKLFAQMEEKQQRGREKKKPRIGEPGYSPKTGHTSRVKTSKLSPQAQVVSPKGSVRHPRRDLDDLKSNIPAIEKAPEEKEATEMIERDKLPNGNKAPKSPHTRRDLLDQSHPQQLPKPSRRASGTISSEVEPVTRDQTKRARDQKNHERTEKPSVRRRDNGSLDSNGGGGRRHCILERERSQDRKRRRTGATTREAERRQSLERAQTRKDCLLDFELFVPGRSVLGSRLIPRMRLSQLERERIDSDFEAERREKRRQPPTKKHYLRRSRSEDFRLREWEFKAPAKRRYRATMKDAYCPYNESNNLFSNGRKTEPTEVQKTTPEGVHMVLISERGKLHDKGEMFDSSHLISKREKTLVLPKKKKHTGEGICLKKRIKLIACATRPEAFDESSKTARHPPPVSPPPPKAIHSPVEPKSPPSPDRTSPVVRSSISSPKLTRSPMLRSLPAPLLHAVSKKEADTPSAFPLEPGTGASIPSFKASCSPSPDRNAIGKKLLNTTHKESTTTLPQKNRGKGEHDVSKRPTSPYQPSPRVPKSKNSQTGSMPSELDTKGSAKVVNNVAMRPLRSAAVPEARNVRSPKLEAKHIRTKDPVKADSPLSSPIRRPSSVGMSDILQQRLAGFLKPAATSPRDLSAGPLPRSSVPLSHSPTLSFANGRPSTYKPQVNGISHDALPSFSNRVSEKNKPWRSSSPANRRAFNSYNVSKGSPSSGSPPGLGGRMSPYENGQKIPFRSSRTEGPGRSDDSSRNGTRSAWKPYSRKNGWAGSIGKSQHQASSDASTKARRGR